MSNTLGERNPDGRKIRQRRLEKGLTQKEVARLSGFNEKTIQRAERGERVRLDVLQVLAVILECTLDELLIIPGSLPAGQISRHAPEPIDQVREAAKGIIVLIPAAGEAPRGAPVHLNVDCTCMVPIGGKPVIYWQLRYLRFLGFREFVVAVRDNRVSVIEFVKHAFRDLNVTFIHDSDGGGVGHTVQKLLSCPHAAQGRSALVVLGDTHFEFQHREALLREDRLSSGV